jgi:hypothetical protein
VADEGDCGEQRGDRDVRQVLERQPPGRFVPGGRAARASASPERPRRARRRPGTPP